MAVCTWAVVMSGGYVSLGPGEGSVGWVGNPRSCGVTQQIEAECWQGLWGQEPASLYLALIQATLPPS